MGNYESAVRIPASAILIARTCRKCGFLKDAIAFLKEMAVCKECFNERKRAKYDPAKQSHSNLRYYHERGGREKVLSRRYGLTVNEYRELLSAGCAICGTHSKLCVDHDHTYGTVRAALCKGCNSAIGLVGEDADRLRAAADYIQHQVNR